ncbi:D-alanyl-D-alanine carboxypeptidase [Kamptonema cortianum]|nr:D-alanyl-D-alanine carboxypeptidase [Geitlerinema splendidum]MDK3156358.1 D-alanyl-D-alanine carboxypeptidase [Kamptonema cortianum]
MLATLTLAATLSINQKIDGILQDPKLKGAIVGVMVQKEGGDVLYERNASLRLVPASNQKIISNLFAIETLGVNFRPQTRFWKDGNDIYVEALGDPTLTDIQLKAARSVLQPGRNARIYVKQAYNPGVGPGWEEDDLAFRYAAPISALTVNKGEFLVFNSGGIPVVPAWTGIKVRHHKGGKALSVTFDKANGVVNVTGPLKPESAVIGRFAMQNPAEVACRILGGTMIQTNRLPSRPADYIIEGPSLVEIAQACLEPSDNVIAENLLLLAGRPFKNTSNPYPEAVAAANKFYREKVGIESFELKIDDGSGLSRHNMVTAKAMARILQHALKQPYRNAFIQALPQAGEGTLGSRLARVPVSAKTGTLDMVSALSGYVERSNGELIIFSLIFNHYAASSSDIRGFQDQIVKAIREADF